MKLRIYLLFLFFSPVTLSNAQQNFNQVLHGKQQNFQEGFLRDVYQKYKSHIIFYDSVTQLNYFGDTLTQKFKPINFYNRQDKFRKNYFRNGFILCKRGDMKGLLDLDGKQLLDLCHFIRFNKKDSLISAFVCGGMEWVFLNFQGDTLSHGFGKRGNYVPPLKKSINVTTTKLKDNKPHPRGTCTFGYLNREAIWVIPPQFQDAHDFEKNYAKVKVKNLWGVINQKGDFVISPTFESDDFEIEKILGHKKH